MKFILVEPAEEIIKELYTALSSRPEHWLGVADKRALRKARYYLGIEEEHDED